MEQEIWKPIVSYESYYEVSNLGNIKALSRIVPTSKGVRKTNERIKKQVLNKSGYKYITLNVNKKVSTFSVHRLVAKAFIDNPSNKTEVNHIDGNKANNKKSNLEWVTALENTQHSFKIGHKSKRLKLSLDKVIQIRYLFESGMKNAEIAKFLSIPRKEIWRVVKRKSWNF